MTNEPFGRDFHTQREQREPLYGLLLQVFSKKKRKVIVFNQCKQPAWLTLFPNKCTPETRKGPHPQLVEKKRVSTHARLV